MSKDPTILQYETWKDLMVTSDWKYFIELMEEHIKYLDKQTILAVRDIKVLEGDRALEAIKYQAKAEDWHKMLDLINQRMNEVRKGV